MHKDSFLLSVIRPWRKAWPEPMLGSLRRGTTIHCTPCVYRQAVFNEYFYMYIPADISRTDAFQRILSNFCEHTPAHSKHRREGDVISPGIDYTHNVIVRLKDVHVLLIMYSVKSHIRYVEYGLQLTYVMSFELALQFYFRRLHKWDKMDRNAIVCLKSFD